MKRTDVFGLISGERDHQNALGHHSDGRDSVTAVAAWVVYMETHIAKAKGYIYGGDERKALAEVRKVAALAVACMEHNSTPPR